MRKNCLYLLSAFLIVLFSTSAHANNEICDALKADGVTKGLYGLCIAYHASGANSQVILDNYNKKKSSSDPVMPGTDVNPPTLSCACWNTLTAEEVGFDPNVPPSACFLSPEVDLISYDNLDNPENPLSEFLYVEEGYCLYTNSVTTAFGENSTLTPEQEAECRLEILDLAVRDFQNFDCLP